MPSLNKDETTALLQHVWAGAPTGYGEFRILKPGGGALRPTFVPLPLKQIPLNLSYEWIERENAKKNNAYFGVNPRTVPRGRNQDIANYGTFIADIDNIETGWPEVAKLSSAGAPPSACVRTARGMHLYWFLKQPEPTELAVKERMLRLQVALHSDHVHDPARILRVPGTICWKSDEPCVTYLAWINEKLLYTSFEINEAVQSVWPTLETPPIKAENQSYLPALWGTTRPFRTDLWDKYTYDWPKGSRSEKCLSFIQTAILYEWEDHTIRDALFDLPLGGHYLERGLTGLQSFEYDLQRARTNIQQRKGQVDHARVIKVVVVPNDNGGAGCKLRLWLEVMSEPGFKCTTIVEWLTVPQSIDAEIVSRVWTRWRAFVDAVKVEVTPHNLDALIGRDLTVEVKEVSGRRRVMRFGPMEQVL